MKYLLRIALCCIVSFFTYQASAQDGCATIVPDGDLLSRIYMSGSRSGNSYVIPVVYHLYYDSNTTYAMVSYEAMQQSLEDLNIRLNALNADTSIVASAFHDRIGGLNIELRLARLDEAGNCISGVMYHYKPNALGNQNMGTLNPNKYLNIHLNSPYAANAGGYATMPGPYTATPGNFEGVFVIYAPHVSDQDLMAHEVGHWVGLHHTFGAGNQGLCSSDDYVADTPPTGGSVIGTCDTALSVCTPGVIENVHNYMDYSTCGVMFTDGQSARVDGILQDLTLSRREVWTEPNLIATGVDTGFVPCAYNADFIMLPQFLTSCTYFNSVSVWAEPLTEMPDSTRWTAPGSDYPAFTGASRVLTYMTPGTYTITMHSYRNGIPFSVAKQVTVGTLPANGLPMVYTYPYTEDFETAFTLPSTHITTVPADTTWKVDGARGYNSSTSLYVPREHKTVSDTNVLVLGTFDMNMQHPQLSFYTSTAAGPGILDRRIMIRVRDLCSGVKNYVDVVYDTAVAESNNPLFAPAAGSDWNKVTANLSYVYYSTNRHETEISLVLVKEYEAGKQDAGFWIDNINIDDSAASGLPPVADFSIRDSVFCLDNFCYNLELVDQSQNMAQQYRWSIGFNTYFTPVVSGCIGISPNDTVGIRLIVTNVFGSDTIIKNIFINIPPPLDITLSSAAVCSGDTVSMSVVPDANSTYHWQTGFPSPQSLLDTTGAFVQAIPAMTNNIYYVTSTDVNGCTRMAYTFVNRLNPPYFSVFGGQNCIGVNDTVQLVATNPGYTYSWTPGTGLSATTGNIIDASPDTTTTYYVTGTTTEGCTNSVTATVTVANPLVVVNITASDSSVCAGQPVTLHAQSNVPISIYYWGTAPCCYPYYYYGDSIVSSPNGPVSFTLSAMDINGCMSAPDTFLVTTEAAPQFWVYPFNNVYTNGQVIKLCTPADSTVILSPEGAADYDYTWNPAAPFTAGTGDEVIFHSQTNGMYPFQVTATDTATGCTLARTYFIQKNPDVQIPTTLVPASPSICPGDSIQFNINSPNGSFYYYWSPADSFTNITNPLPLNGTSFGHGNAARLTPPASGTYYVTKVSYINGCATTIPINVTVNAFPALSILPASPVICDGDSVQLSITGATSYQWLNPTALQVQGNGSTAIAFPSSTQNYTVKGTGAGGCAATASVTVTVNPVPQLQVTPASATICTGDSATFLATGADSYQWSPSANITINANGDEAVMYPSANTVYTITGTAANGCTVSENIPVNVHPQLIVTTPASATICEGDTVTVNVAGALNTQWFPQTEITVNIAGNSAMIYPSASAIYTVEAVDGNGCEKTDTISIIVNPAPAIPVIVQTGNILTAPLSDSYQWYLDGALLAGETNQQITIGQNGNYTVEVGNSFGCTALSQETATTVSVHNIDANAGLALYPNPTSGAITIVLDAAGDAIGRLEVYNAMGQRILLNSYNNDTRSISLNLNVANGWYVAIIRTESGKQFTRKFEVVR